MFRSPAFIFILVLLPALSLIVRQRSSDHAETLVRRSRFLPPIIRKEGSKGALLQWWTGECHGAAHVLELREARWLEPYVGERQPRQYRAARTLRAMVRERHAAAGVNASFFWADRRGLP